MEKVYTKRRFGIHEVPNKLLNLVLLLHFRMAWKLFTKGLTDGTSRKVPPRCLRRKQPVHYGTKRARAG